MQQQQINVEYIDHMGNDMRVVNMARQSFGKWQDESQELSNKDLGLLEYLSTGVLKEDRGDFEKMYKASVHWAPYAHCMLSVRVRVPVFIARQLVKHQVGLCLSEDTEITFVKQTSNTSNGVFTKTLKQIADHWFGRVKYQGGAKGKRNVSNSNLRVYNEETQRFELAHISNVIDSGVKAMYAVSDEYGNTLQCTKEHQLLTQRGWVEVGNLSINDWLIRSDMGESFGHTPIERGNAPDVAVRRAHRLAWGDTEKCNICGGMFDTSKHEVEVDHIVPCAKGGQHEPQNLQTVCVPCHKAKSATEKSGKTTLLPKYVRVTSIEYVGEKQCYDISVPKYHNFLANGFVAHNCWSEESRRYISDEVGYWLPEVIHAVPDGSIKQGSGGVHPQDESLRAFMWASTETAIQNYYQLLKQRVAPEEARMVLPLNHMVNFSWTGSLLALLRVLKQRQDGHAQLAAQEFASKLKPILEQYFPHASKAFTKYM